MSKSEEAKELAAAWQPLERWRTGDPGWGPAKDVRCPACGKLQGYNYGVNMEVAANYTVTAGVTRLNRPRPERKPKAEDFLTDAAKKRYTGSWHIFGLPAMIGCWNCPMAWKVLPWAKPPGPQVS